MPLTELFFAVSKISGIALAATLAVTCIQLIICWSHRIPKRICYYMLYIVIFRLLCPVSISSPVSIFNLDIIEKIATRYVATEDNLGRTGEYEWAGEWSENYEKAMEAGIEPEQTLPTVKGVWYSYDEEGNMIPVKTTAEVYGPTIAAVWLTVMVLLMLYGAGSYFWLRRKVMTATRIEDNVYESDHIKTAFILGFIHPKIYLPLGLSEEQRKYVVCHERMHIKHGDHIVKAVAYIAMCIHWFNIMLWVYFYRSFKLLLEEACDDDVINSLGEQAKASYGETLVAMSSKKHFIGSVPCAFGECSTQGRVKEVLKHKRTSKALTAMGVLLLIAALVVCGTDAMP
jgi:hypothetical protein